MAVARDQTRFPAPDRASDSRRAVTVENLREGLSAILRRLQDVKLIEFTQLFSPTDGVPKLVVTFLAILELARETLIEVTQQQAYSPIYVKPTHGLTVV